MDVLQPKQTQELQLALPPLPLERLCFQQLEQLLLLAPLARRLVAVLRSS